MRRRGSLRTARGWPSTFTALIGLVCVVVVLALAAVMAVYLWPPPASKPEVTIDLDIPIAALSEGQAVRFTAPPGKAFEMTDGGGLNITGNPARVGWLVNTGNRLVALAAKSSDTGCDIDFDAVHELFMDPCHGEIYALDGHVIHGPARAPLAHLSWTAVSETKIAVQSTKSP